MSNSERDVRNTSNFLSLVLRHQPEGAWGCGVFRDDPNEVASWFASKLKEPAYHGVFETVYFAVLDNTALHSTIE